MTFTVFTRWQVLVIVIQVFISKEARGMLTNTSYSNSIFVPSPKIFYVNKNDEGKYIFYFDYW